MSEYFRRFFKEFLVCAINVEKKILIHDLEFDESVVVDWTNSLLAWTDRNE